MSASTISYPPSSGSGSSPLTTKGDIYGFSTVGARIPVGADGTVLTADSTNTLGVSYKAVTGTGTVTSVSVVTANGVSGTVANSTTTPVITLVLGAITPTSVNGTTATEIGYVSGVTSSIQTQLNAKQPTLSLTTTGTSGSATFASNVLNIPNYTYTLPTASTTVLGGVKVDGTSITITGGVISATGSAGTPGGSNTQVQYNNAGAFGGISGITTNGTNATFAGGSIILAGASTGTASVQYASTALSGGTFTFPGINSTQTVAVLGIAQTFTADTTFSSINGNFGSSTVSSTYQLGYGATISGQTKTLRIGTGGVSGSTTSISIGSAFGTTVTFNNLGSGLLNVTSGVLGLAAAGTDYQVPITLTTTGTSGAATFSAGTLNIPQYTGGSGTVTSVAVSGGTTGLTTSGSPITTSGTITLSGTLGVANGGTGVTTSTGGGAVVLASGPTLTSPQITTIINTGTLTLPTSTDTLVGRATTDTLTNKTISGLSNTLNDVNVTVSVTQTAHGFSIGNLVRWNGTAYVDSKADAAANAEVAGIVSGPVTTNTFILTTEGAVSGLSGLTAGTEYFLDATTAGAFTAIAPATVGQVSKPVFVAISATNILFHNYRGSVNASAGTGTVTSVSGSGGTTGLTLTGGPITSSGTLTLGGTLAVANGGTGSATQNFVDLTTTQTAAGAKTWSAAATFSSTVNKVTITAPTTAATLTLVTGSSLITAGAFALTLTSTATTNATIPAGTVTLQDLSTAQTITGVKTYSTAPVFNALPSGTAVASAATASTISTRDSSANLTANSHISGYATTATAAGTTTLTVASAQQQYFTGTTTQTVTLPVTSTLVLGQQFSMTNNSTALVTVQSSGANIVAVLSPGGSAIFTCILTSGTTASSWNYNVLGEWWEEIGRSTITTAGNTISLVSFAAKKYLRVMIAASATAGTISVGLRYNNDPSTNYSDRVSTNGGGDSTDVTQSSINLAGAFAYTAFLYDGEIFNLAAAEKNIIGFRAGNFSGTGSAAAPDKAEIVGKWANTSTQITRVDVINLSGTGSFAVGSEVIVLGHN